MRLSPEGTVANSQGRKPLENGTFFPAKPRRGDGSTLSPLRGFRWLHAVIQGLLPLAIG